MDQETKEYLDQKHVSLARKEDMEKLRQEMKATFRQWREENQSDLLESKKEIKSFSSSEFDRQVPRKPRPSGRG